MPELKEFRISLGATLNLGNYENVRPEVSATFTVREGENLETAGVSVIEQLHTVLVQSAMCLIAEQPQWKQSGLLVSIGVKPEPKSEPEPVRASMMVKIDDEDEDDDGFGDDDDDFEDFDDEPDDEDDDDFADDDDDTKEVFRDPTGTN